MAALPDGADAADAERSIHSQHEAQLANLATHQLQEQTVLETGSAVEEEPAEAVAARLQSEKEENMKKIMQDAEKLGAKCAGELQQMEAELEEQIQRDGGTKNSFGEWVPWNHLHARVLDLLQFRAAHRHSILG